MKSLQKISFLTIMLVAPFVVSDAKTPVMPQPLRGVWYADTPFGQKQCKSYRRASSKRDYSLVTALVISMHDYKSYADYLEGDYMVPIKINKIGHNSWLIKNKLFLDVGEIGDYQKIKSSKSDEFSISSSRFLLKNNRLHMRETTSVDLKTQPTGEVMMFKCL